LELRVSNILVVEDDPSLGTLIADILDALRHDFTVTREPDTALSILRSAGRPDLMICNTNTPDGGGLAVLEQARNSTPPIPVLAYSETREGPEEERARRLGAKAVIQIPCRIQDLRKAIEEALG